MAEHGQVQDGADENVQPLGRQIYSVNGGMVALVEAVEQGSTSIVPAVRAVPGGGRVFIAAPDIVAAVVELLGPSAQVTNPYEQKRRKEFMRRAARLLRC